MIMYDALHVTYDESDNKDLSGMAVHVKDGDKIKLLTMRLGEDADNIYRILTEQGLKFKIEIGE